MGRSDSPRFPNGRIGPHQYAWIRKLIRLTFLTLSKCLVSICCIFQTAKSSKNFFSCIELTKFINYRVVFFLMAHLYDVILQRKSRIFKILKKGLESVLVKLQKFVRCAALPAARCRQRCENFRCLVNISKSKMNPSWIHILVIFLRKSD